ncbi:MAG: CBS domain-containing protein [Phycisphaera sp.]|nr:CBS domain-containing protein [Phycisphaera sp.]
MKRKRRDAPPGDFQDPLSNYDPPIYADDMEKSLCEDSILDLKTTPFRTVSPDMKVCDAIKLMVEIDVACLLVTEGDKLLGIFSERDVLNKVTQDFDIASQKPIGQVMTQDPMAVYETDTPADALNIMATAGFRHIPVLDVDDKVVGILGPRRITAYLQHYFE